MEQRISFISADESGTLSGLFAQRVAKTPHGVAYRQYDRVTNTWEDTTWGEMAEAVGRWQEALRGQGLEPGDKVALRLRNSREWITFEQAAIGLGLVVIPLYTDDRPDNVAYIIDDAHVKLLLVQDVNRWLRLAPALVETETLREVWVLERHGDDQVPDDDRLIFIDDLLPATPAPLQQHQTLPEELATIVYTSGTTGKPKGVMLSHRNILSVADMVPRLIEIYTDDCFLSFLPLSHTLERTAGYYLPMMTGSTVAFARSVTQLADDLQQLRPTILIAVPRIFERIHARLVHQLAKSGGLSRILFRLAINTGWHAFERAQGRRGWHPKLLFQPMLQRLVGRKVIDRLGGRLRFTVSGGAALSPEIARMFIGLGLTLLQGYGLTETSPVISANLPNDNEPNSVGAPLPGIQVRLGPDHELQVSSPGVMLGYWNNHAATADMIDKHGWLNTGDQARIDKNGHIYITGRIKDILVLSNGEKVPPADMEMTLIMDPLIEQALIVGEGRQFLSALLVLNAEHWPEFARSHGVDPADPLTVNSKAVHHAMVKRLAGLLHAFPGYAKVRRVYLDLEPWTVENGMLTPTLKTKRAKVIAHYAEHVETFYREVS